MEQPDILDELQASYTVKRSNFLTVLCILTWVGCGLMLLFYLVLYATFHNFLGFGYIDNTIRWQIIYYIVASICIFPCLAGSILMWNMKKYGFIIYAVGEGVPVLLNLFIMLNGQRLDEGLIILSVLTSMVPIGFIIMYATNLKTMSRPKVYDGFN